MLREETLRLMEKHNITLDPSLDEQQLVDPRVIKRLIEGAEVNHLDTALDIGAGLGNITVPLAGSARRVYAVERDPKFLPSLRERTAGLGNVVIVHGDALRIVLPQFTKIASNIPFAICEPLIQRLLPLQFERASLIVPESYERTLTAHSDDQGYTKLTLVANAFFKIRHVEDIEPEAYLPHLKIKTSILTLEPRVAEGIGEDVLRRVILQADKKLKNALREALIGSSRVFDAPETKRRANALIGSMGIGDTVLEKRVSRLSLADLIKVSGCL